MDIGLDENFDLALDGRNDIPLVTGRKEFEQRLRFSITSFFQRVIGDTDHDTALRLIEVEAKRIARRYSEIERVIQIQANYDNEQPNTINLVVIYDTGDEFTFPISD